MACPFFAPSVPLAPPPNSAESPMQRMPLGDAYAGICAADPSAPFEPSEPVLRRFCNCGYARGLCSRFPSDHPADAVRFSIFEDQGRADIRIVFIVEQYHSPLDHGPLRYSNGAWIGDPPSEPLASQARAFIENYLSRKLPAMAAAQI